MKDPAFLFYPNDWLGGTMGMTFEEKGAYIELLMAQFNRGHMTEHMIGQIVGQLWVNIKDKFTQDENCLWYNKRLEEEQNKRKAYTESRRNNIQGKNQYSKNKAHKGGHMTCHMENVNVIENDNVFIKPTLENIRQFCFERNINLEHGESFYSFYSLQDWWKLNTHGNQTVNLAENNKWMSALTEYARKKAKEELLSKKEEKSIWDGL